MEKTLLHAVLVLPVEGEEVLLAVKTRNIGAGCWNGYGGGIEEGETPITASIRELFEESGLRVSAKHLEKVAIVDFHNTKSDGSVFVCRVHVFLATNCVGVVRETDEMRNPTWFTRDELPIDGMMPADRDWMPPVLVGKKLEAKAWYGPHQKEKLRPTEINFVDHLDD